MVPDENELRSHAGATVALQIHANLDGTDGLMVWVPLLFCLGEPDDYLLNHLQQLTNVHGCE